MNPTKNFLWLSLIIGLSACQQQPMTSTTKKDFLINEDTLSVSTAKSYVQNYAKKAGTIDIPYTDENGRTGERKGENTRAIWFSIERLKALVDKIEAEGGDGIRFYYATYDSTYNDKSFSHVPPKPYWNRNTLVMVSTKDSLNYHKDYYTDKKAGKEAVGFIVDGVPENRGEICPPPNDCSAIGATLIPPIKK